MNKNFDRTPSPNGMYSGDIATSTMNHPTIETEISFEKFVGDYEIGIRKFTSRRNYNHAEKMLAIYKEFREATISDGKEVRRFIMSPARYNEASMQSDDQRIATLNRFVQEATGGVSEHVFLADKK